jgi:NAD(P)H-dependent FMN reductase
MKLEIIIASTRSNRIGGQVGGWITDYSKSNSAFDVSVADLKDIALPFLDEPKQPISGEYQHDHTKAWSARIDAADAFVVVMPEYNFNMPPSLVNAIDYLHFEWKFKPVGFVGYGGTGALRAIQAAKLLFVNLAVMPVQASVTLPGIYRPAVSTFEAQEGDSRAADRMLAELYQWSEALMPLRNSKNAVSKRA